MKFSFSTLGCPRWTWNDVFSTAKDLDFDGVEIRGLGDKIYAPDIDEFSRLNIEDTKKNLERLALEIPILTSGAALAEKGRAADSFVEACAYVNLAARIGTPYIRVMGTGEPQVTEGDFALGSRLYFYLCRYASEWGVTPLIETNGALSSSDKVIEFIDSLGGFNCGVLWDVHHTVRFGGETPETTVKKLGSYIKHVHVKDSVQADGGKIKYCMMGEGDVPVKEAVEALKSINYDGFVSLEWVKRWMPNLEEPGIVFAHYASYMRAL